MSAIGSTSDLYRYHVEEDQDSDTKTKSTSIDSSSNKNANMTLLSMANGETLVIFPAPNHLFTTTHDHVQSGL